MSRKLTLITLFVFAAAASSACYNTHTISKTELAKLSSGQEQFKVTVVDNDGEEFDISAETPLEVQTTDGSSYRITPFNFLMSDTQLVAPDYDLLLPANAVSETNAAEVRDFSYGKTFGLIGGIAVAVAGGFVALALTQ